MLVQRVAQQFRVVAVQDAARRFVDLLQDAVGVQRQHGIVHAVQNGLVVIARGADVLEQLRVLDGDGGLGRECPQPPFVGTAERPALAVQDLHDADLALAPGDDRHAQHAVGTVAGVPVDLGIEAGIAVGVGNVDHPPAAEAFAGNAGIGREADLRTADAAGDAGKQLVAYHVVEEQGAAVCIEQRGGRGHDLHQQRIEVDFGNDRGADFEQHGFLALLALDLLEQPRILERRGSLQRQPFEQALVFGVELSAALVQHLGDAYHLALLVADRNAEDVARVVAGVAVDVLIEARVGIGIGDDLGLAAGEDRAGDTEVAGEADFADRIALDYPREQLIGLGIVQKQRTAVGVQGLGDHGHQARKQDVEREAVRDAVGYIGKRLAAAQVLDDAMEQLGLACVVEPLQQSLEIFLMQVAVKNLANVFQADLHTNAGRHTSSL